MSDAARLIIESQNFAAHAHARQLRDDMGDSYLVHIAEVAAACARVEPFDPVLVAAAILHDTVEDTWVEAGDLRQIFGGEIADVVGEVTDAPDVAPDQRHAIQAERMKTASRRARLLKVADKTSNIAELLNLPAAQRPPVSELQHYLAGARMVIANCRGLDAKLEAAFDATADRLDAKIAKLTTGEVA